MRNCLNNKKGFTLVELLAVIVVLGIVMAITAAAITGVLDATRKNAFVSSAQMYIDGARQLANADMATAMMGQQGKYIQSCTVGNTYNIPITDIKLEKQNGNELPKSSYGFQYLNTSQVVVRVEESNCSSFSYSIYLEDSGKSTAEGAHGNRIGSSSDPIAESSLSINSIVLAN